QSEKGERKGAELASEPALCGGAREIGNDDHPKGLCRENEHEGDAVRSDEAVGLGATPEFVREQCTGSCRRQRDHYLSEPGECAASQRARCSENVSVRESHRCPTLL